ncbi:hypothetical protein [Ramlibacter rhizophilus]|uniref:DUF4785 family protein n=1 Tax=Ramlibacter rhizophilus TaxID=1781167 RepID=A0A4Z0C1D2_9BURK|nr:hypothetical protein [Ramlibacter rhizophilus]TFZ05031.1 hypothetical protein EZ242_04595 [Ramlibacter rhizophilus]
MIARHLRTRCTGGLLACLVAALFAVPTGAAAQSAAPAATAPRADPVSSRLVERSDLDRGAVLAGPQAVEFELPPNASSVRILLNPGLRDFEAFRARRLADPELRLGYTIAVEVLGGRGRPVLDRPYTFRRDLQEAALADGTRTTGAFYLDRSAPVPLRSDQVLLDFQGTTTPTRLRLRLSQADPAITDVLARVYVPVPQSRRDAAVQWQRLSPEQRARMASGNLFPPQVLSQDERERLVASRWAPVAPRRGASVRELYVVRDLPATDPVDATPPPPPGLPVGPGQVATLPLQPGTGGVHLQLTPLAAAPGTAAPQPGEVVVRWAGENAFQRQVSKHRWAGTEPLELRLPLGAGWVEVASQRPAALRAWGDTPSGTVEVTPEPAFLRLWSAGPGEPLTYDITHAGRDATPLRLVFRRLAAAGATASDAPARVELLLGDGSALKRAQVPLITTSSMYDIPAEPAGGFAATEPTEAFFRVPPPVQRVRISSSEPLLVGAYTRPAGLARQVRTPDDSFAAAGAPGPIPAWFTLRPLDHETRLVNGASRVLRVQSRPPEDRPDLAAGQYVFEDFDPVTEAAARVFLAPREPGVPDRDEALSSTFRPLPADGRVALRASPGRQTVQPRLAWATRSGRQPPFHLRIRVDGGPVIKAAAAGMAGEVLLPPLAPGAHVVGVQSDAPVRWWINHAAQGEPWVRREALQLDRPLSFEVERRSSEQEFLSVRAFQPADARRPLRLRVRIEAPEPAESIGPFPGWLFTERVHEVQPSGQRALPVAETAQARTDPGRSFFIPLPDGAPRGRYRITIEPDSRAGWMTLSRVTPGLVAQRKLTVEGNVDEQ